MTFGDPDGHDGGVGVLPSLEEVAQALKEIEAASAAGGAGVSFSAILTGAAIVFIPAHIFAPTVGQSNADEIAERDRLDAENAQKLGQGRGAGEEQSQSDEAKDKTRTNGGLVKPDKGPGSVPPDQRDPKRTWTQTENQRKLDQQKRKCANCGQPIPPGRQGGTT